MAAEGSSDTEARRRRRTIVWVLVGLVTALWVWMLYELLQTDLYRVPSESMQPTYDVGSKVVTDLSAYDNAGPLINDVVVFHAPVGAEIGEQCGGRRPRGAACTEPTAERSEVKFIKRVVALPGDRLSFKDGVPVVNGAPVAEEFLATCRPGGECNLPVEITIPRDHYFTLGDNVGESQDSRFYGPVPREWLVGRVTGEAGPLGLPLSFPLVVLLPLFLIAYVGSLVVAGMKRRWLFLVVGLFVLPAAVLGAALEAKPESYWERRKRPE